MASRTDWRGSPAQLLQHEWAKHGTCMPGLSPANYFRRSTGLYRNLRYPDMDALSRQPLTAGRFAEAFAAANPGLDAEMVRVTANKQGWLDELWLCLDTRFRYERCRAGSGGLPAGATLKIWRGPGSRR
jgi:ribonuclease T2